MSLSTFMLVLSGGGLGAVLRWRIGLLVNERYTGAFPLGTFLINVSGGFLMGFLSVLFSVDWTERFGSNITAFLLTGVLGGYTTFSSYQLDAANLFNKGERRLSMIYLVGSVLAGLLAAAVGAWIASLV